MSTILIADTVEGKSSLERILSGHDLVFVSEMREAQSALQNRPFDMCVASLHFDESQMFELVREIRRDPKTALIPIICFCSRQTEISRVMHESLQITTRALGAWMYLSEHDYNGFQNPDAELRRVMERCLTEEARKENLQKRIDIQKQRGEIQNVRLLLSGQSWSPDMQESLTKLKSDLELLLTQVTSLQANADVSRATVKSSRGMLDRVAEHVTFRENHMSEQEADQVLQETLQSEEEDELSEVEHLMQSAAETKESKLGLKKKR